MCFSSACLNLRCFAKELSYHALLGRCVFVLALSAVKYLLLFQGFSLSVIY